MNKLVVVGVGLIGGSFAAALKRAKVAFEYIGVARRESVRQEAVAVGLVDRAVATLAEVAPELGEGDVVFIAVPTLSVAKVIEDCARLLDPKVIVTDGASVKGSILQAVEAAYGEIPGQVVLGHPIAGSEKSGVSAADPYLYRKHKVILTPTAQTDKSCLRKISDLWLLAGAEVVYMDVEEHDQVLAATSHLPHLLAFALVDALARDEEHENIFRYAAGGFRDFTRIASSDPQMWHDIMCANGAAIVRSLDLFTNNIQYLRDAIVSQESTKILELFTRAKSSRDEFAKLISHRTRDAKMQNIINYRLQPGGSVTGRIRVPGDKSISHRSIMLGSLAEGTTQVTGFLEGEDALATIAAFRGMGVQIEGPEAGRVTVHGVGLHGLQPPAEALNMGNSGTSMRLLSGIAAGQSFDVTLTGDESLSKRPMNRVADPLRLMGVTVDTQEGGRPPITIHGKGKTQAIHYDLPMASAQVKSCVLLAGLYGEGTTSITEPAPTRDHTERMLRGFGYPVATDGANVSLPGGGKLVATDIDVPADISSATFFLVAAAITPGSDLTLEHVGVNPTRIGVINILRAMGANLQLSNEREVGGEPVADIRIQYAPLKGIDIPEDQVPLAIDEFPALFIAAACAEGATRLSGAEELRVKESDRIQVMADGLVNLGVKATPTPDGMIIEPGPIGGGDIFTHHDHRIAMAFTVAALAATDEIRIHDCANVATSFPGFVPLAKQVGILIEEQTL
ncbi:bifunctional prephenate dehydrogenase/3-phosphoshikimate 1-carboxyvinyltransferase [Halioxenophilus sp. WMMB6]|uniref:bifunctional prephenate dehydrogenase/3-phosphoshikimate 1-carboxyvinyltransferase n=1 Tax=Halioxenophilus sp. WMMB6 TaxID=3073815 RepID=UPI00295EB25C|nr:bifunctional prephenate dehydrogenase/3-phosphoshikimate 1-carboxyvinyltransferase [Halioxenophilus sp. WMMB6]